MKQISKFFKQIDNRIIIAALAGAIVGATLFIMIRFIFNKPQITHYHANFAVFVNGKREMFAGPGYYEEVQACSATSSPRGRTHLHQPDNNVVHVHDKNVTWGHFFESIGWALGPDALITSDGVYKNTRDNSLMFFIDTKQSSSPFNKVINNEETLVVSYGSSTNDLKLQFEAAKKPTPAHKANIQTDPAACRGEEEMSLGTRFKQALW